MRKGKVVKKIKNKPQSPQLKKSRHKKKKKKLRSEDWKVPTQEVLFSLPSPGVTGSEEAAAAMLWGITSS